MDFSEFLPTFISESLDNLVLFEDALMDVSSGADDPELINQMFCAVHSIKGGASDAVKKLFSKDVYTLDANEFEQTLTSLMREEP
jgi:chemotaxis protein histidine kinase CheA